MEVEVEDVRDGFISKGDVVKVLPSVEVLGAFRYQPRC